jgi:2-polyprenyl-3-methyl-5-hydroxy-6-metoxy-1,4-benzoquinol methylase
MEDFTHLDNLIKTGTIFSIKCEQLELQHDWEVEIGINNDKNGILAQFLYYNSRDNSLHAPVEIENKNKAKLVNIIKECINNPNISLNEQIRGNIYDLNLLNDIKSNLKEYVWERIFPCTVFSPLRPFMIHMDRYRFASENIDSNQVVVDAACGMGYGTKFLSKFSQNAIGIDISEESIQMAQKYYQSDNIQWKVGDVLNLNIGDDSIDVFTSMETFEHITPPEQLLSEISRVLKKDGIAFISTPNGENYRRQQVNNPYHEHEYSYDELVSIYDKFFKEVELFGSKELGQFDLIDYGKRTEYENIIIKASNPISS